MRWIVTYKRNIKDAPEETIGIENASDEIAALKMARRLLDLVLHADDRDVILGYGVKANKRAYKLISVVPFVEGVEE